MIENDLYLGNLKSRYRNLRIVEIAVLSLGIALIIFAVSNVFINSLSSTILLGSVCGALLFVLRYRQLQLHRLTDNRIAAYLNRQFVELQDSADLLLAPADDLGPLQQLQQEKIRRALEPLAEHIKWPDRRRWSLAALVVGLLFVGLLPFVSFPAAVEVSGIVPAKTDSLFENSSTPVPVTLKASIIMARPPAYTGLKTSRMPDFNIRIPEGTSVSWQIQFSGTPESVSLLFSDGDSAALHPNREVYTLSKTIHQSGFYQLSWQDAEQIKKSDYFKLEVIPDQIPKVAISNQEQFVELRWDAAVQLPVKASLADDYGLSEAYVIATVSKGNGESVKFREEKLLFEKPAKISGTQLEANLVLRPQTLGMEPGDELYYYVEAWDNRSPRRQSNRTETYFIQLQDTATQIISFEGGLGVDLMPEYFRSQRQIIIDSEKLLTERSKMDKTDFNSRSNELGYDQKVLRLRYGQFLGEEFESGITTQTHDEEEEVPENEAEVVEQFGHTHDSENEHNLVAEPPHEHKPGEEESPLEAFAHSHDNMEEATFFVQSVKAKLRAALTLMWDAELHLRMFDPAESLPFQYKILKLLKEISNDSRIYVHRTGFDPPPLKEEKRLSGSLEEVNSSRANYSRPDPEAFPNIRKALPIIERLPAEKAIEWEGSARQLLTAAGGELAAAAIEQPDRYLEPLSALKAVLDGDRNQARLLLVRKAFWQLLPDLPRGAAATKKTDHPLQEAFIDQLKAQGRR